MHGVPHNHMMTKYFLKAELIFINSYAAHHKITFLQLSRNTVTSIECLHQEKEAAVCWLRALSEKADFSPVQTDPDTSHL